MFDNFSMTSLTEQISINNINHNSKIYELETEQSISIDEQKTSEDQENIEENENLTTKINGFNSNDALNHPSPTLVNSDNQQEKEVKESSTVHHDNDENRSKKII